MVLHALRMHTIYLYYLRIEIAESDEFRVGSLVE